jgi:nucleotide-binding universal stress UspA family protein
MFARTLVPLDDSPLASKIIPHARRLLAPGGELTLLSVVDAASVHSANLLRQLSAHRDELARDDVRAHILVREGDPARAILAAAKDPPQDLIAMSTHGRSGLQRLSRGSVAEAVLRESSAPILVANPRALERPVARGAGRPRRILVPIDGGPHIGELLELVEAVGRGGDGVTVKLLRVEPMTFTEVPSPLVVSPWDPRELERSLSATRDYLSAVGIHVEVAATFGFEAQAITKATEEADLVVMGTSGRRGLLRLVQGSVAEEVLRHAACPVLVRRLVEE